MDLAFFSGLLDVDAMSLSLARASLSELAPSVAAIATVIAVSANTLLKLGLVVLVGSVCGAWAGGCMTP